MSFINTEQEDNPRYVIEVKVLKMSKTERETEKDLEKLISSLYNQGYTPALSNNTLILFIRRTVVNFPAKTDEQ